jgi:S1-C subfamily serine protease
MITNTNFNFKAKLKSFKSLITIFFMILNQFNGFCYGIKDNIVEEVLTMGVQNIDPIVGIYEVKRIEHTGKTSNIYVYISSQSFEEKTFFIRYNDDLESNVGKPIGGGSSYTYQKLYSENTLVPTEQNIPDYMYKIKPSRNGLIEIIPYGEYPYYRYVCIGKLYPRNIDEGHKSQGTGFLISRNGWLVTNKHVLELPTRIKVLVYKNGSFREYPVQKLYFNYEDDLALIKIDYTTTNPVYFSNTTESVGNKIFALGYPKENIMGRQLKITDGIINSSTGINGSSIYYQFSAAVQPGNSGGPLLNNKGNLCGVVTSKLKDGEMVSYALKPQKLKMVINDYNSDPSTNYPIKVEYRSGSPKSASQIYKESSSSVVLIYID